MTEEPLRVPAGLTTDGLIARRYMARIIDSVLLALLNISLAAVMGLAEFQRIGVIVALPLWIAYEGILESCPMQGTVGKRLMGLRVYNAEGGRLAFVQALGRNSLKDGPFFLFNALPFRLFLSTGWLVIHLVVMHSSPVYQAIHDRVLRTWVAAPEAVTQLRIA